MKVSLFLGAGASVPYGMPTTRGFKDHMMRKCGDGQEWFNMLARSKDIEEVLTAVMEVVRLPGTLGGRHLENRHSQITETFKSMKRFEELIKHEVHEAYSWNTQYNAVLDSVIGSWLDLIKEYGDDIDVFTTNYDRSVEEHCSNRGQPFKDGFEPDSTGDYMQWMGMREDDVHYTLNRGQRIPPLRLFKLHGSLGWKLHMSRGPVRVNYEKKSSDPNQRDLLIYPSLSPKAEEAAEPYATIFDRFHKHLMSSDACIVVGFSFRDEQICDKLIEFVRQGKRLIVVSPTGEADVIGQIPESRVYLDPQAQLPQTQAVKIIQVVFPGKERDGSPAIIDIGGRERFGQARGEGAWLNATSASGVFSGARHGRAKKIYVIENAVDEDSISEIVRTTRDVLSGRSRYT